MFFSHDLNNQQCSQNVQQHQVNHSYAQSISQQSIKSSPRSSLDAPNQHRLLDMEKQHLINSLSTTSGGYVCSTSSESTKHNNSLLHNQVRLLSPSDERIESLSRLSSVSIDDTCPKSGNNPVLVTARKSSHKISPNNSTNTTGSPQSSFKGSNQQGRKITSPVNSSDGNIASTSATTIDPSLLLPKTKYNRRNNPDLEKRRIHFCDHPGIDIINFSCIIYLN